jgi:hypothetical protein
MITEQLRTARRCLNKGYSGTQCQRAYISSDYGHNGRSWRQGSASAQFQVCGWVAGKQAGNNPTLILYRCQRARSWKISFGYHSGKRGYSSLHTVQWDLKHCQKQNKDLCWIISVFKELVPLYAVFW